MQLEAIIPANISSIAGTGSYWILTSRLQRFKHSELQATSLLIPDHRSHWLQLGSGELNLIAVVHQVIGIGHIQARSGNPIGADYFAIDIRADGPHGRVVGTMVYQDGIQVSPYIIGKGYASQIQRIAWSQTLGKRIDLDALFAVYHHLKFNCPKLLF